ncbi:MAG TPA: oxygen-dependent coproporphyrinogen oxidase [Candidatus Kapabacteria bacterium]|nr:oxygen-dependent coproporphyrinogen oxidase [Candidatus Kapabacteria bacterium]
MDATHNSLRLRCTDFFQTLQEEIISALESLEGTGIHFREDTWDRQGGGGGRTRVLEEGYIFEKAGVNFSAVHGESPQYLNNISTGATNFFATGISLVLHPRSPRIPTVHANFRYFELSNGTAWFGGGMDLTPYYLDEGDAIHFHKTIKNTCDKHNLTYYAHFKKWCDDYFFINHRGECRGIGGIFFDNLSGTPADLERTFSFQQDIARTFLPAYIPIVEHHKADTFSDEERRWQGIRRGRYVEFNLVYDKGTVFGLETQGRIESILMSLPTTARWEYDHQPRKGSEEARLVEVLKHPREWVKAS